MLKFIIFGWLLKEKQNKEKNSHLFNASYWRANNIWNSYIFSSELQFNMQIVDSG